MICHHICICNTCMIFWRAWKYMNFISQWDKILQNSCSNESIREWISKENSWFHVEFWFQWMLALGYSPLPNGEAQQDVSKEGTTPLGIIIHALALAPPTYNDGNPTVKVAPSQRGASLSCTKVTITLLELDPPSPPFEPTSSQT